MKLPFLEIQFFPKKKLNSYLGILQTLGFLYLNCYIGSGLQQLNAKSLIRFCSVDAKVFSPLLNC
ncbi:hypothetical protein HanHA300_Chr13g0490221 [Helianthus annuus]|nr:hypothetical protein HanHA300_Chr13g0490221 [Helianthus annuus]KAJ0498412.1 hypothetical protein HanHA89_Chr13g0522331 [Helianthus annuus]KAJ0664423.1 hypothetical protein HanLR1_Chr13g0492271 [Helianthus annuus]